MKKPQRPPSTNPFEDWKKINKIFENPEVHAQLLKVEKSYPYWKASQWTEKSFTFGRTDM